MSMFRRRYTISIDTNASQGDRDSFRQEMANGCDNNGLRGYFIVDEGSAWIHLEGEETDIDKFARVIANSPVTTGQLSVESNVSISAFEAHGIYTYDQAEDPIVPD